MNTLSPAQAVITAMITPALLILASGSLIATALVRLARVVDRIRKLAELANEPWIADELARHERRAYLAERAIMLLFLAVACFVLAGFAIALDHAAGNAFWAVPVGVAVLGMAFIVGGAAAMVAETRLSIAQIQVEIARIRTR
jgi:uncharacterized membrane protein (DUF485 family)